tara:strand:+ start:3080 stop:3388 length:309 start_codon:yes stop_codon:yes gene_type:complete
MSCNPVSEFLVHEDFKSYPQLGDIQCNKYLKGYTKKTGSKLFNTKKEAYEAMMDDPEAGGIVKSSGVSKKSILNNKWSVRKGVKLNNAWPAKSPEIACLKLM